MSNLKGNALEAVERIDLWIMGLRVKVVYLIFATPLEGVRLERGDHVIALSNNCGIVNERKFCSSKFLFRVLQGMI